MKQVFVITDPGLDPDDLVNAWLLVKLQQQGLISVVGMTANFAPALQRARLLKQVLNQLGATTIPVACGSECHSTHGPREYEFDFPLANEAELAKSNLLVTLLKERIQDKSLSLLLISGLTDIAEAIRKFPKLLIRKLKEVYIMGGASWQADQMIADPTASNNRFDQTLNSQIVYDFFVNNRISLRVFTRYAAYAAAITPSFYDSLKNVNSIGSHLNRIQTDSIQSLWQFASSNPPEHRQNRRWFSQTFCSIDDLPIRSSDSVWRFVKKLAIYDPLTTMWMVYPELFAPSSRTING